MLPAATQEERPAKGGLEEPSEKNLFAGRPPRRLIEMTKSAELIAPSSLHWEVGNVFSAMFRRNRTTA
jgi:hypothetical protein